MLGAEFVRVLKTLYRKFREVMEEDYKDIIKLEDRKTVTETED